MVPVLKRYTCVVLGVFVLFVAFFFTSSVKVVASIPLIEGSYFKYNIIGIPNPTLEVNVKFENPYYNFTTKEQPRNGNSGLMYYEPMPSDEKGFVYITAVSPSGIRSDTFVIDNIKWWKQVVNSKNGYVMEHTFRPAGTLYLDPSNIFLLAVGVLVFAGVLVAITILIRHIRSNK